MNIWWVFLFLIYKTIADQSGSELANNGGIFQVEVSTKNIGRIKYRDGEVVIAQNQQKHTDFFFTPFPYVQPENTQCHENVLSDRIELGLQIELYTPQLIQAVKVYLYKYQSSLCGNMTPSSVCDVSLLPMNSIRLVQKGSRSNSTHYKYTLEESWQSATLLLQSMEFIIYASNMTVCEQLRRALTEKCRLPNFEIHYTLHGQQTVQRQLEVNTEHVASTNMYNQIRAQFPSAETVILTGNDFKELLSESTDRITMTLRTQEGFENLQDPVAIDKLLEQQLSTQQVRLDMINNKLWENLYWTPELTRPDRLAKVLNSIVRKESDDSERFVYDRQAAKDAMKLDLTQHDISETDMMRHDISEVDQSRHDIDRTNSRQHNINQFNSLKQHGDRAHLTHHDKQRLGQFDKLFDSHSRSSSSSNSQNYNDDAKGEFKLFDIFSLGGGASGASQTRSESSDNRVDVSSKEHRKLSDADILNVTHTDKHNLNVLGIGQNHLNTTQIDKERSANTRINNNNLNQMAMNTNNLNATKIDKDTNKQYTLSRHGVEKLLREMSNNVYLEGEIIKPRPINARLVKIGKISTNTKLFSNTVLVRMRSNVHVLPLRCKPDDNDGKLKLWLTDRIDRMENVLGNLSNHMDITKLHGDIRNVQDKVSVVENKTEQIAAKSKQEMDTAFSEISVQANNLYTNLTDMMKQEIDIASSKINVQANDLYTNLTDMMKQEIDIASSKINVQANDLYTNLTDMTKQKINDTSIKINVQANNLYTNLTNMVREEINAAFRRINTQNDNLYTSLTDKMKRANSSTMRSKYSSSLTAYSPTYSRPNDISEYFYYEAIRIYVFLTGTHTIMCNSSIDTFGYIYHGDFHSILPDVNLLASDDDGSGSTQFELNINLQAETKYILVVTTYTSRVTGTFLISGTDGIFFDHNRI